MSTNILEESILGYILNNQDWNKTLKKQGLHLHQDYFTGGFNKKLYSELEKEIGKNEVIENMANTFDIELVFKKIVDYESHNSLLFDKSVYRLMDKHKKVKIIQAYEYAVKELKGPDPSDKVVAEVEKKLESLDVVRVNSKSHYHTSDAIVDYMIAAMNEVETFKSGYPTLDKHIKFVTGEYILLAARSGAGKTGFLINILRNMTNLYNFGREDNLLYATFFSLEMSYTMVGRRYIEIEIGRQEKRGLSTKENDLYIDEHPAIIQTATNFNKYILLNDTSSLSPANIEAEIIKIKRIYPNMKVVGIDYLGLMKGDSNQTQYKKITDLTLAMKPIAKRQDVLLFVLVQTGREGGEDGTTEFGMNQLRDSGQIEESCDVIIGGWKDLDRHIRHGKILKNRHGSDNIYFNYSNWNLYSKEIRMEESK